MFDVCKQLLQSWVVAVHTLPDIFSCWQEKPSGRGWALSIPTLAKSYRWTGYLLSSREMNHLEPPVRISCCACDVSSFNGYRQLWHPTCSGRRNLSNHTQVSTTQSHRLEKKKTKHKKRVSISWPENFNKKSCSAIHWHFIPSNPTIFRVFTID